MQYIGDNARFLAEAVGDMRGILDWYRMCLRALAAKRHPELLAEIAEMERKVDLGQLLEDMPAAISQSIEGIARVSATTRAFKDFCESGTEPVRIDLAIAVTRIVEVTRNHWKQCADMRVAIGELPRIVARPRLLDLVLVDIVLAAATYCGSSGGPVLISASQGAADIELHWTAQSSAGQVSALSSLRDPCDLASTRALLEPMGGRLEARAEDRGWSFHLTFPITVDAGSAAEGIWS
ncbi:MAG: hypothetical protein H0V44_18260 [Planctomycetes bacterium]|nr:hypothetical protein [Planctomycetota bacterium]